MIPSYIKLELPQHEHRSYVAPLLCERIICMYACLKLISVILHCRLVVDCVSDCVDYWVTFNEPHVFCMLTYCAGAWPGGHPDMLEAATSALPTGVFKQAMHWMAVAHLKAYDYIHRQRLLP